MGFSWLLKPIRSHFFLCDCILTAYPKRMSAWRDYLLLMLNLFIRQFLLFDEPMGDEVPIRFSLMWLETKSKHVWLLKRRAISTVFLKISSSWNLLKKCFYLALKLMEFNSPRLKWLQWTKVQGWIDWFQMMLKLTSSVMLFSPKILFCTPVMFTLLIPIWQWCPTTAAEQGSGEYSALTDFR